MKRPKRPMAPENPAQGSPAATPESGYPDTAEWFLTVETGMGFPQGGLAALAGLVVGLRALGRQIGRLAAWLLGRR